MLKTEPKHVCIKRKRAKGQSKKFIDTPAAHRGILSFIANSLFKQHFRNDENENLALLIKISITACPGKLMMPSTLNFFFVYLTLSIISP
jgi:hypothetical protein